MLRRSGSRPVPHPEPRRISTLAIGFMLCLPALLLCVAPASASSPPDPAILGSWSGPLVVGPGIELRLVFHIEADQEGRLTATMDSPDQGATGIPIQEVTYAEGELELDLPQIQGGFRGTLLAPDTLDGRWSQGGQSFPLRLVRGDAEAAPARPQTPEPPFPYRSEDVRYPNPEAEIHLAGTLTIPEGDGPFPAVALITGSGAQDRDETILGHRPFWVLADHLSRNGIAVLRSDDRGVGESEGDFSAATSLDFAGDAAAAVAYLATRSEVEPSQIGLIGHSEGGLIAPLVANERGDVAFVVLLAGPAMSGEELLPLQGAAIQRAMGAQESDIDASLEVQQNLFRIVREEDDPERRVARMEQWLEEYLAGLTPEERERQGIPSEDPAGWITAQAAMGASEWFRFFLAHDPRESLRDLEVPVLALFGELDLQVPPEPNRLAMEEAFRTGEHPDWTIQTLPGLNHLFQTATTGSPTEYARIEETFAPAALEAIAEWIRQRTDEAGPLSR